LLLWLFNRHVVVLHLLLFLLLLFLLLQLLSLLGQLLLLLLHRLLLLFVIGQLLLMLGPIVVVDSCHHSRLGLGLKGLDQVGYSWLLLLRLLWQLFRLLLEIL